MLHIPFCVASTTSGMGCVHPVLYLIPCKKMHKAVPGNHPAYSRPRVPCMHPSNSQLNSPMILTLRGTVTTSLKARKNWLSYPLMDHSGRYTLSRAILCLSRVNPQRHRSTSLMHSLVSDSRRFFFSGKMAATFLHQSFFILPCLNTANSYNAARLYIHHWMTMCL